MMQLDLIDAVQAAERRDIGMASAAEHADAMAHDWTGRALEFFHEFAVNAKRPFLTEDVVSDWNANGFDAPPDGRAWGAVVRRAAKAGVISKVGYAPANTSNRSPKVLWRAA